MGSRIGSTAPCRLADLVEIRLPTIDVTLSHSGRLDSGKGPFVKMGAAKSEFVLGVTRFEYHKTMRFSHMILRRCFKVRI